MCQLHRRRSRRKIKIPGLDTPVAPGSTIGGCLLVNAIKAEVAARLTRAGHPPKVLTAGAIAGAQRATELFEAAYDEHAHRLAKLYENPDPSPGSAPGKNAEAERGEVPKKAASIPEPAVCGGVGDETRSVN